jgi:hypothetical protein
MRILLVVPLLLLTAHCDRAREPKESSGAAKEAGGKAAGSGKEAAGGRADGAGTASGAEAKVDGAEGRMKWSATGRIWAEMMRSELPTVFCTEGSYFTSCFKQSAADCRALADRLVKDCLDRDPDLVPQQINAETGRVAGQRLGTCAGGDFETELRGKGKFTDTARRGSERARGPQTKNLYELIANAPGDEIAPTRRRRARRG